MSKSAKNPVKANNLKASNKVRIGGGVWRSRLLAFPDVLGLRPTPDRVRQTVFNWLGQDLTGKTCCDLFAGTGVMGFEALSRNAKSVTLLELSKPAFIALQANKIALQGDAAQLIHGDALQFLSSNTAQFDIIFCDPPYQQQWLDKILPHLKSHLAENGVIYAEAEYALTDNLDFTVIKSGKAGNVYYHLLKLA